MLFYWLSSEFSAKKLKLRRRVFRHFYNDWLHNDTLCFAYSCTWRPLMSQEIAHREGKIDLYELLIKLWEGKWTIRLAMIGASILGMLYSISLPSSY